MTDSEVQQRAIDVVRGLAMDGPNKAKSGHQGTAMAMAPLATVLWTRIMKYDPQAPDWPDRDRFILSAGHASILQYSMLHLTGYDLTLEDLEEFRQWDSRTPGHPEVGHTAGIEVTTGPLGQGFANGVGMAIAEQSLRTRFGADLFDHHIYAICGDGDLEEGVSHEAASLAGHLGLGRLVYAYDDNHISIDGPTELALSDNAPERFRAYGWDVHEVGEVANDCDALEAALLRARGVEDAPSLIVLRSHIGYPSPDFTDDPAAHGLPFDDATIAATKEVMGLPAEESFFIPDDVAEWFHASGERGRATREAWQGRFATASSERDDLAATLDGHGLAGWDAKLPSWDEGDKIATRKASNACLEAVIDVVPGLVAGAADLIGNTGVALKGEAALNDEPAGRQIHFGIREHAMGSIMTGMAHHGGLLPIGGTFFVFSDYMRPAVRLAALSDAHVIYSWTHDSVGVGEDGPTHQPVEHLASLRAMPGLCLIRPADANETAEAWKIAVEADGPVGLILTRQGVPVLAGTVGGGAGDRVEKGAYVLSDDDAPQVVLIGTGSEVAVCVEAAEGLRSGGVATRVVSMPSWELFEAQDESYRSSVLPDLPTLSVEAGVTFGWERWADDAIGIDRFGASAPGGTVLDKLGINATNVEEHARALLGR